MNLFTRPAQHTCFLLLQIFLERFELWQAFLRLRGFYQHYLNITQVIQVIELFLQKTAHLLEARVRVNGAQDIEYSQ